MGNEEQAVAADISVEDSLSFEPEPNELCITPTSRQDERLNHSAAGSWDVQRTSFGSSQLAPEESSKNDDYKKLHESLQGLNFNKLNYEAVGLVGREQEVDTLRSCLYRAAQTPAEGKNVKKELVLIQGDSGVGKTAIAVTAKDYVGEISKNGTVVLGKFDRNSHEVPYSGISAVFGELCKTILEGNGDSKGLESFRASIREEDLVPEIELVQRLVPSLSEVAELEITTPEDEDNDSSYEAEFERLKYAFRCLTELLCSHFSPLVLILDNIQWADTASLQTIDFLLSDTENENGLVIVGLYRTNVVLEEHLLLQTLRALDSKCATIGLNITKIKVQCLDTSHINQIIMSMLGIDNDGLTQSLAELCFRKTRGNPFFVIEFMRMLEIENMISFNLGLLKWGWDEKAIEERTATTTNVIDMMQSRMKRLPENLQTMMHYAACLGTEFKTYAVGTILAETTYKYADSIEPGYINDMFRELQHANFIDQSEPMVFRWVHDKIQEAALSYGLALEPTFHFDVGRILCSSLSGHEFEEMLFEIVNLINKGSFTEHAGFAKLNLRAAKKARSMSAFHSAASYAYIGTNLLPNNKWTKHSKLTLELYTLGAEMEVALGNIDTAEKYINIILFQTHLTQQAKLPVYIAKSRKLCNIQSQYQMALDFLCRTLKEFGCSVPLGVLQPFHALRVLKRTVNAAKKRPTISFETPKLMTDPSHKAAMSLLSRVFYASYFTGDTLLVVFSASKMVQMTLDHGVSPLSGQAYASLGRITNAMWGDWKTSTFLAESAMVIQKSIQSKYIECQTLYLCSQYILGWTSPIKAQLDLYRRAYSQGMRSGNNEYALWARYALGFGTGYMMGKPLQPMIVECERMVPNMEDLQHSDHVWVTRSAWQLALNLRGLVDNELVLEGWALTRQGQNSSESKAVRVHREYFQSELYLFFAQYKLAAESALERGEEFTEVVSGSLVMLETFHRAVALYAMARKTRNSKYAKPASRLRKRIATWAKNGNPNVKHYDSLLQAEHAAFKGKYKDAKLHYEEAINIAASSGHLHHAGLFNERFAELLHYNLVNEEESMFRLSEAIRWYGEWGADLKVELLSTKLARKESSSFHLGGGTHRTSLTSVGSRRHSM